MVSAASRRGDRVTNQDQVLLLDGALAVLDGATSWLPQDPSQDGGWYARMLGAALTRRLPGRDQRLAALLADAITEVRETFALEPDRSPYSTATVVRWDDDLLEVFVLGDSPVVVAVRGHEPEVVADDRLEPVGSQVRSRYRQHLRDGHGFDETLASLIAEVQRIERRSRNREGGFWVAGADPMAAHHAVERTWRIDDIEAVLAMSDGAAAAVLEYGLSDWTQTVALACSKGPAAVIAGVHAAEETDPEGRRWPRTKRHDDKTLAVLTRR
jgi:hypothetical protein